MPLARMNGPATPYSCAIFFVIYPTPFRRLLTALLARKVDVIPFRSSSRPPSFSTKPCSMALSISRRCPPILFTEKIRRPPVEASNMSRIFSRRRQHCINRLSKPNASASRPSQSRWLCRRDSSHQMVRRYFARGGSSTPMMCSTASQYDMPCIKLQMPHMRSAT